MIGGAFFWLTVSTWIQASESAWLLGCFRGNLSQNLEAERVSIHRQDIRGILEKCSSQNLEFVHTSCIEDETIFLAKGPSLHNLNLTVVGETVFIDEFVELQAEIQVANKTTTNSSLFLHVNWSVGNVSSLSECIRVTSDVFRTVWLTKFPDTGIFKISVIISNGVEVLSASINVTVSLPTPTGLQITHSVALGAPQPTCIPAHLVRPPDPTAIVFRGQPLVIQASLTRGRNVTFHWLFSDDATTKWSTPSVKYTPCKELHCLSDSVDHVFASEGVHSIQVNATTPYGSLAKNFSVLVISTMPRDLHVELEDPSLGVVEVGVGGKFHIEAMVPCPLSTLLQVSVVDDEDLSSSFESIILRIDHLGVYNYTATAPIVVTAAETTDDCRLSVWLQHRFETEGSFRVFTELMMGELERTNSSPTILLSALLDRPVTAYKRLLSVSITGESVVATDKDTRFLAHVGPNAKKGIRLRWRSVNLNDSTLPGMRAGGPVARLRFNSKGFHRLTLVVSNPISSVTAEHVVVALESVSALEFDGPTYSADAYYAATGDTLQIRAFAKFGTSITFDWIVKAQCESCVKQHNTFVVHAINDHVFVTFRSPGKYIITALAHNLISHSVRDWPPIVIVQDPVRGLKVHPADVSTSPNIIPTAAALEPFHLLATVTDGSDMVADFAVGTSPPTPASKAGPSSFLIQHVFRTAGRHEMLLRVSNTVSVATALIDVVVQDRLSPCLLRSLQDEDTVLLVFLDNTTDVIPEWKNVLYEWRFNNGQQEITQTPLLRTRLRSFTVEVTIRNRVLSVGGRRLLAFPASDPTVVLPPSPPPPPSVPSDDLFPSPFRGPGREVDTQRCALRLEGATGTAAAQTSSPWLPPLAPRAPHNLRVRHAGVVVPLASAVDFSFEGFQDLPTSFTVEYRSNRFQTTEVIFKDRWQHVFNEPGIYLVNASWSHGSVQSVLSVQRAIESLQIRGPDIIDNNSSDWSSNIWEALCNGSDVVFQWRVEDTNISIFSADTQVALSFALPGRYTLSLEARNGLGTQRSSHLITAVEALNNVELDVRPAVVGSPCLIRITVTPAANYTATIYYGDGMKTAENNVTDDFSGRKTFILERQHIYFQAGQYLLKVNVTNQVTWMSQSAVVIIEEAIRDVQVLTDTPSIVPVMQEVLVTAHMKTGTEVAFQWNFGESQNDILTIVENNGTSSTARHMYKNPGLYHVTVKAVNSLVSSAVIGRLASPFVVMEPIRGLIVKPLSDFFAAPLLPKLCNYEMDEECDWSLETEEIYFEAQTQNGSHVEFIFHYGDASSEVIVAEHDRDTNRMYAVGRHHFTAVGDYNVTVIARNSLSNSTAILPHLFSVQIPPDGIQLDKDYYIVQLGSKLTVTATVATGTDVSFNWWVGKELLYRNAGAKVHILLTSVGIYEVVVVAVNKVTDLIGSPRATANVGVQNLLQAVELRIVRIPDSSKPTFVFSTDDEVQFRAKVLPDPDSVDFFTWQFETDVDKEFRTKFPFTTYRFNQEGRYILRVSASNTFGSVISSAVEVTVIRKLERLSSIRHVSATECNQTVYFHAQFWFGSHLTFQWDFDDGSDVKETSVPYAEHAFQKVGEYWVKLYVWNLFSHGNITTHIFVVENRCDKPEVAFLEQSKDRKIIFGTEIRLEADVEIVCQASWVVAYTWKVLQGEREVPLPPRLLRERTLLLTGGKPMMPGNYTVHLKVAMNGTIVYASVETSLAVLRPPLQVVIHGGTNRLVNRKNDVIFNVTCTSCGHPDVRFQWSCQPLSFSRAACFDFSSPDMTQLNLTFPASAFRMLPHKFLFSLTVTRGQEQTSANQIIQVVDGETSIDVSIFCPNCETGVVDRDAYVSFQALCKGCDALKRPLITWQLWLVKDGRHNLALSNYDCVQPDGSTFYLNVSTNSDNDSSTAVVLDIHEVYPTRQKKLDSEEEKTSFTWNPFNSRFQREILIEPSAAPRSWFHEWPVESPESHSNIIVSEDLQTLSEEDHDAPLLSPFSMPDWDNLAKEGVPGEAGSANARDHRKHILDVSSLGASDDIFEGQSSGRPTVNRHFGKPEADSNGDALKNDQTHSNEMNHLLNKPRVPFDVEEESTTTGFHSMDLIIRPGVLKVGRTYIAEVNIKDEANPGVEWSALQAATVNVGPVNGRCTLMPTYGVELDTRFKLDCLEWRVHNSPVLYELSYSLTSDEPAILIYYGMDHNFKFNLPMGLPDNDYKVYLTVVIRDGVGIGTKVCSIVREVQPWQNPTENMEEWIYRDVTGNSSALTKLISERNSYLGLQRLRVLLTVLNRQSPISLSLRRNIRQQMTSKLQGFPQRDKMEIIQILTVLNAILDKPKEIATDVLTQSVRIISAVVVSWLQLLPIEGYREDWPLIVIQTLSNILTVISVGDSNIPIASVEKRSTDNLLASKRNLQIFADQTVSLLLHFLHLECQSRQNNRDPLVYRTKYMVTWSLCNSKIPQLPEFLPTKIVMEEETHFLLFNKSPFIDSITQKVNTEVIMISSNEDEATLADEITVDISYPLNDDDVTNENGTIRRTEMNVHRFNVIEIKHNQTLFVYVEFSEKRKSDFPLELLISSSAIPKLSTYIFSQTFGAKEGDFMISLSANNFLEPGDYFIGIADAAQNKRTVSSAEIYQRPYSLRVWWTECFYWDNFTLSWSQNGCVIQPMRNFSHVRCSCISVSPVGASFRRQQTEYISTIHLGTLIEDHSISPTVLLVAILGVLYVLAFLPCYYADIRDEKKKQIHHLVDNSSTDKQVYSITIITGNCLGAGTTATVYLILHGEEGMSETRELTDDISQGLLFQRSSRDTFIMTTPRSLGSIWKIQIWHNNGGSCPSWFLSTLVVTDMNSGAVYFFECHKWLAVEEDERIEREILCNEIPWTFRKVLHSTWLLHLDDSHLWLPILRGATYTNFFRLPRITCCIAILLTTAGLESVWFSYTKDISDYESFLISWESLYVSAVVCSILMPLQLLLTILFKYSKLSDFTSLSCGFIYPQVKKCLVKSNTEPIEESFPMQENPEDLHNSQISLDQSVSAWRALQEWARLQWLKHSEYISALEEETLAVNQKESLESVADQFSETRDDDYESSGEYDIIVEGISNTRLKPNSQEFLLPVWCRFLTWVTCWLLVIGSSTTIFLFSFGSTNSRNNKLLITWYLTVLWNVFISPYLIVTILALYSAFHYWRCPLKLFCYQHTNYKDVMEAHRKTQGSEVLTAEDIERQEIEKRRRSRYLRFARPPSEKKLIQDRKEKLKEKFSFAISKYIFLSSFFLLYFILTLKRWDFETAFLLNKAINHSVTSSPTSFLHIKSQDGWWWWMAGEGTEILGAQYSDIEDQLPLLNTDSFLIAPLRLIEMKHTCTPGLYNHSKRLCNENSFINHSRLNNESWYQPIFISKHEREIFLSINRSDLSWQLKELQDLVWVSNETYQVKLECILYQPATNFFTLLQLLARFSSDGDAFVTSEIESISIKFEMNHMDIFLLALKMWLAMLCLWKIQNSVEKLIRDSTAFWSQNWNWIHGLFHIVFLIYLGFECYFEVLLFNTAEKLKYSKGSEFVDLVPIIVWRQIISGMEGLLFFILVIKMSKSLFPPTSITRIEQTCVMALKEIANCAIHCMLLLLCFSFFGFWWFGSNYEDFSSVPQSVFYLIRLTLKELKNGEMRFPSDDNVGALYIATFAISIFIVVIAQMKAIFNQNYKRLSLKRNNLIQVPLFEVIPVLFRKLLQFFKKSEDYRDPNANQLHADFNLLELEEQVSHMLQLMEKVCDSVDVRCEETKNSCSEPPENLDEYYFDEIQLKTLAENIEGFLHSQKTLTTLNSYNSEFPDYSTLPFDVGLLLQQQQETAESLSSLSSSVASVQDDLLPSQVVEKVSFGSSQAVSPLVPNIIPEKPVFSGHCETTTNPFLLEHNFLPKRRFGINLQKPTQAEHVFLRNLQQSSSSSSDHPSSAKNELPVRTRRGLRKTTSRGKGKAKTEWNFEDLLISDSEDEAV